MTNSQTKGEWVKIMPNLTPSDLISPRTAIRPMYYCQQGRVVTIIFGNDSYNIEVATDLPSTNLNKQTKESK